MIGDTTIRSNKVVRKHKSILKTVIVYPTFQEQANFVANKSNLSQLFFSIIIIITPKILYRIHWIYHGIIDF